MGHRPWMIYGAYGYTGELIAREAVRRGLAPVLAGRDAERTGALAGELGLENRAFALDAPPAVQQGIEGMAAVLHCAGPFLHTSPPMVEACFDAGCHYLDITGEVGVLERVLRLEARARQAGIVLLPGVGFDVVPTDCLAARLAREVPDATHLSLAFHSEGGGWSRGTLATALTGLPHGGAVRREGRLRRVPLAHEMRQIEFRGGRRWAMTVPWGDLATAWKTTGIPNIEVFAGAPRRAIRRLRRLRLWAPLLRFPPLGRLVRNRLLGGLTGPDATTRERARSWLWGEVRGPGGGATATMEVAEGYSFTATAAVECVVRVLEGRVAPGAWTPAGAFGAEFATELVGTSQGPVQRFASVPPA